MIPLVFFEGDETVSRHKTDFRMKRIEKVFKQHFLAKKQLPVSCFSGFSYAASIVLLEVRMIPEEFQLARLLSE